MVIRLVVMMYVRFPLSLRNVEDLLAERGIDICHETVRMWWNRFGPMFAGDIRRQRVSAMRGFRQWRWHLDEMYVKLNGEMVYLWRAVDHEGEILESYITRTRCLIPRFDGAILSLEWKEAVWDRYVMGAPRPRTPSEQQYSDRRLRSRR
ncbi:DDE-type integrase/transposase/recombinase [Sphingomonadaceae bacterium OTU29MARTA1]|nr:DDE-type integrase/transposase/recombinase [Sphingomonadaceae bacterium OTU29MARTA1]